MELGSILEPGRPPKTDKAAILIDAVRMVTQLRSEAQKLKDSNLSLQEKIKELKVCVDVFSSIKHVFFQLITSGEIIPVFWSLVWLNLFHMIYRPKRTSSVMRSRG